MKAFFADVWRWFLFGDTAKADALDLSSISIREDLRRARERAALQMEETNAAFRRLEEIMARAKAESRRREKMRKNAKHLRPSVQIVRRNRVTRSTQQGAVPPITDHRLPITETAVPRAAQEGKR